MTICVFCFYCHRVSPLSQLHLDMFAQWKRLKQKIYFFEWVLGVFSVFTSEKRNFNNVTSQVTYIVFHGCNRPAAISDFCDTWEIFYSLLLQTV